MLTLLVAFLAAAITNFLLVRFSYLHVAVSGDPLTGPQKLHTRLIPRIGGLGIFLGMVAGATALFLRPAGDPEPVYVVLLVCIPAVLCGVVEDLVKGVPSWVRLSGAALSALLGILVFGAVVNRVGIPGIDQLLLYWPLAWLFTIFAATGVTHAVNIVDGLNGLSAGTALLILIAFAYVGLKVHDMAVFHICLAAAGAILGFLIWNFPAGLIFLGDGGAYLLGLVIAEAAILLVARNPQVSPWFPLLAAIYPVFETLFSMYRRVFVKHRSPIAPDALHLHSLIYRRLVGWLVSSRPDARYLVQRNALTTPYLWGLTVICIIPAILFYRYTYVLMGLVAVFSGVYIWLYGCIVKFRSPVWLRRLFALSRLRNVYPGERGSL